MILNVNNSFLTNGCTHIFRCSTRKKEKMPKMIQIVFVFLLNVCLFVAAQAIEPMVTLPDGTLLRGGKDGHISFFKGIPFAQPPIN